MNTNPLKIFLDLKPIGIVHTRASDEEIRVDHENLEAEVEIYPEYSEGLEGLRGFSHIFVLAYFNKLRPEQKGILKVRPRRLLNRGFKLDELPLLGVFALSSPTRPNPVGLSLVQLLNVKGRHLTVKGLDYFDATPVVDIKPYKSDYRVDSFRVPDWYTTIQGKAGEF